MPTTREIAYLIRNLPLVFIGVFARSVGWRRLHVWTLTKLIKQGPQ